MELLVLTTLKWRMQTITPFSFIDYFINKINSDQIVSTSSIDKPVQLILSTLKGESNLILICDECSLETTSLSLFCDGKGCKRWTNVWVEKIQCRNWLLGIQAFCDCSSSGNLICCKNWDSRQWESTICSSSPCTKGKYGGPKLISTISIISMLINL